MVDIVYFIEKCFSLVYYKDVFKWIFGVMFI